MIGPSNAVVRGDELWFYYTSAKYRRTPAPAAPNQGAISLAVLRRDGFISFDADDKDGQLTTTPFALKIDRLFVNVAVRLTARGGVGRQRRSNANVNTDHRRSSARRSNVKAGGHRRPER